LLVAMVPNLAMGMREIHGGDMRRIDMVRADGLQEHCNRNRSSANDSKQGAGLHSQHSKTISPSLPRPRLRLTR
jgi:hypothetical protein